MDIRKQIDINSLDAIHTQMQQERAHQCMVMESARNGGMTRRERDKMIQKSRNRYKVLEQAHLDTLFADDRRSA